MRVSCRWTAFKAVRKCFCEIDGRWFEYQNTEVRGEIKQSDWESSVHFFALNAPFSFLFSAAPSINLPKYEAFINPALSIKGSKHRNKCLSCVLCLSLIAVHTCISKKSDLSELNYSRNDKCRRHFFPPALLQTHTQRKKTDLANFWVKPPQQITA